MRMRAACSRTQCSSTTRQSSHRMRWAYRCLQQQSGQCLRLPFAASLFAEVVGRWEVVAKVIYPAGAYETVTTGLKPVEQGVTICVVPLRSGESYSVYMRAL